MIKNFMNKAMCLVMMVAGISFMSCSNDETISIKDEAIGIMPESPAITLTEEGYLNFSTTADLEAYFKEALNGKVEPYISNSTRANGMPFQSVAALRENLSTNQTRAADAAADDLEEMTVDEYNLMKAENLLFDDILTHIVDTTLRICVDNRIYKITKDGTFSASLSQSKQLEAAVHEISPSLKKEIKAGETIQLNKDVTFTNTFADIIDDDNDDSTSSAEASLVKHTNVSSGDVFNTFHDGYNVDTYDWKNKGFKRFLDWLRGKDVSKSKNFNSKHRVKVNVFDVNYVFYASAGIRVKMEKRKKFLGVKYWVGENASKLAIGFNDMEGEMKYNTGANFSNYSPSLTSNWKNITGTLNGIESNFIYGNYHKLSFLKDWTDYVIIMMPEINFANKNWAAEICNKIYNAPAKEVYNLLKSLNNKYVYNPIKKSITPKDPRLAYFMWGNSTTTFNREHPYIMGVKEYDSRKSKSVIFDRSFGFSVNIGSQTSVSGFLPTEFDIKKIDAFGAAYYDGRWLGVRFVTDKN